MKKSLLKCSLLLMALGVAFVSCNDDISGQDVPDGYVPDGYVPGEYHYSLCVPNANDERLLVLDSITAPIKSIGSCPDWVVATVAESTQDNHPAVRLTLKDCGPGVMNKDDIEILSEYGDKVVLSLTQSLYFVADDNSSDDFLTDWENAKEVEIYSDRARQRIPTPWARETITTLPENIRYDVKKKDGWEMAFSFMNRETFDDCNYFALYNRYLGTLRIFYYVTNPTTTGSEYAFEVDMGSANKYNKFPFYHALAYGIPSNHVSLSNTMDLLGNDKSQFTFKSFFSTYKAMSSTALAKGWTAFDIDASAYNPHEKRWVDADEQLQIACRTELKQSVSLTGSLTANISGKYSSAEQTASAASGVSSTLQTIGNIIGDVQNSALTGIEQIVTGSPVNTYCRYVGAACNVAAFAYDYLTEDKYAENITDSMPGKIEMSLTGDIKLKGYIESLSSNCISPITLRASTFKDTNKETHFGQGVWGVVANPVIYVVEDCIMGDVSHFNLYAKGDGSYENSEVENYHLRMVSFLDPTSLQLNLNTELFPDVSEVEVITFNYGVYPEVEKGHTSKYASLLKLERSTTIEIVKNAKSGIYRFKNANNATTYVQAPHTDFMSKVLDETSANCKVVKQYGADYSYYGKVVDAEGKNFIMQPQVYFPIKKTDKGTLLCDGEIPDFVVLVTITFNSDGRTFVLSQRYLPKIVTMKRSEVPTMVEKLEKYKKAASSGYGKVMGCEVSVCYPNGAESIQKTIDILNKIK
mgnify:FL=1